MLPQEKSEGTGTAVSVRAGRRRLADFGRALYTSRTRLARADRLDGAGIRRLQQQRLDSLVRHAVAHSPFYRDRYRGIDTARVDLAALPPVTKADLMARFDDWVTDSRLKLADLDCHLERLERDDLYLGQYRVLATSGSSGQRGVFAYSRADWCMNLANFARLNERFVGVHPRLPRRLRVAAVASLSPVHISTRTSLSAGAGVNRVLRLDARRPLPELVRALQAFQPEFLVGFPSALARLAHEQQAGNLRLRPAKVATVSEARTPEMTDAMRAAWSVQPFDWYGITEGGVLAADCEHHRGMHVFEDLFVVENVDAEGRSVDGGAVGHRILLTNLFNRTQPIIRYELSDMVALDRGPCPAAARSSGCGPSRVEMTTSSISRAHRRPGRSSPDHLALPVHEAPGGAPVQGDPRERSTARPGRHLHRRSSRGGGETGVPGAVWSAERGRRRGPRHRRRGRGGHPAGGGARGQAQVGGDLGG